MQAGNKGRFPADAKQGPSTTRCSKQKTNNDGLFVGASILGTTINCLIDSGSTITVIHPSQYYQIPTKARPVLQPDEENLRMADGSVVSTYGTVTLPILIQGIEYLHPMTVAEVEAPAVLGYDFLHRFKGKIDFEAGT